MDIDLVNDLRRDDNDDNESDENDGKLRRDDSDNEESKTTNVEAVMKKANEAAKKKVARRPRPKLDVDRLTGPRGMEELCNLFQNEKFQGKGHEFADLDTVMHKYEYWAHRLVPHMAFDDFIEKAEKLGGKRPIKNGLQHFRDKLSIQEPSNEHEQASHTLIDLLPTLNVPDTDEIASNDIPDDDELNELLQ